MMVMIFADARFILFSRVIKTNKTALFLELVSCLPCFGHISGHGHQVRAAKRPALRDLRIAFFYCRPGDAVSLRMWLLRNRLPQKKEWKQLALYGLLNISIYLGLYVIAMQQVSPGLGTLAVATNPVFISLLASIFLRQRVKPNTLVSLLLCTAGVLLAAYPLLQNSSATPAGLMILLVSMLAYSAGVLYFSRSNWEGLHMLTINGWQTLLGGVFLLPALALTYKNSKNTWDLRLAESVLWLALPVSIVAVQLWLLLLRENAVKASFWLFLCPISGYIIALLFMKEPIGIYTVAGMALVITGLWLVQRKKQP